jgi:hypothetical protein
MPPFTDIELQLVGAHADQIAAGALPSRAAAVEYLTGKTVKSSGDGSFYRGSAITIGGD